MKKKLEADLISIAHRILQMKNKSDVNQLYVETQKLYEKLSVLKFVEDNFGDSKPTIGQAEIIEKLDQITVESPVAEIQAEKVQDEIIVESTPVVEEIVAEEVAAEVIEPVVEEIPEIQLEETISTESAEPVLPVFELEQKEEPKKEEPAKFSFEDLLGANYDEPLFVKVDHTEKANPLDFELPKVTNLQQERVEIITETQSKPKEVESKPTSVIDKPVTGINIGLNDRIAFVKHLFANSNEDYIRVLNQLITFDSFEEAQNFIEDMVKPDYNNWEGKEDYSERFIQIIEKKFA